MLSNILKINETFWSDSDFFKGTVKEYILERTGGIVAVGYC